MPLGPGIRYRVKTYSSGKRVRLAFRGRNVVETKSLKHILADHIKKRKKRRVKYN